MYPRVEFLVNCVWSVHSFMTHMTPNRVLLALPTEDHHTVLDACERVELEIRTTLDHVGDTPSFVHFPETAVVSTLSTYSDGSSIEMANIGREACTGIGLILGHPRQLNTNEVQVGGRALAMPAKRFVELKASLPAFERVLFSAVQAVFYQVMVSGACNGTHGAKQRLARWLLTMRDRNDEDTIRLTQDFLAEMLGVRRATVTEASQDLQSRGLITYSRGQVRITDREGLRQASCECYDLVRNAYDALLPAAEKTGS